MVCGCRHGPCGHLRIFRVAGWCQPLWPWVVGLGTVCQGCCFPWIFQSLHMDQLGVVVAGHPRVFFSLCVATDFSLAVICGSSRLQDGGQLILANRFPQRCLGVNMPASNSDMRGSSFLSAVAVGSCRTVSAFVGSGFSPDSCFSFKTFRSVRSWVCQPALLVSEDLPLCAMISWKCGLLATCGVEASHPGPATSLKASQPSDILGTALQEAHPSTSQVSPGVTPTSLMWFPALCRPVLFPLRRPSLCLVQRPFGVRLPWTLPKPRTPSDPPSTGRWYCTVQSCPEHWLHTSRGWSSFNAMKGNCRILSTRVLWEVPVMLPRLHRVPTSACLWAPALRRFATSRSPRSAGSLEQMPQRRPRRGHRQGFPGVD